MRCVQPTKVVEAKVRSTPLPSAVTSRATSGNQLGPRGIAGFSGRRRARNISLSIASVPPFRIFPASLTNVQIQAATRNASNKTVASGVKGDRSSRSFFTRLANCWAKAESRVFGSPEGYGDTREDIFLCSPLEA